MRRVFYTLCALFFVAVSTALSAADHPTIPLNDGDRVERSDSNSISRRHVEAVKSLTIKKDTLRAERLWRDIIAERSDYAPALYNLSKLPGIRVSEAERFARGAYEADTTNKWYLENYTYIVHRLGDYNRALQLYNRLLVFDSKNLMTYYYIMDIYSRRNQPYSAIAILDSAELRMGRNAYFDKIKTELLLSTHQYDLAIDVCRRAVVDDPSDVDALILLATTYEKVKRDSLAYATYEQAYRADTTRIETIVDIIDFNIRRGDAVEQFKYEEKLFKHEEISFELKLKRLYGFVDNEDFYRNNYFRIGGLINVLLKEYPTDRDVIRVNTLHLYTAGMFKEARDFLHGHLDDDNVSPHDFTVITILDRELQDLDALLSHLERGLKLFPYNIKLLDSYAQVLYYSDGPTSAIKLLRDAAKGLKSSEDLSICWGRIGDFYHSIDNDKEAFKAYRKALGYNIENAEVLNNYAYYLSLRDEQLDIALEMSQMAITLEENNYNYIDTYAWVLHRLGRNEEAKRYMRQALVLSQQSDASLLAHFGDILWALGEKSMAEIYWQKAVDAGYDATVMAEHISQIKQNK